MARPSNTPTPQTKTSAPLVPMATDPRAELFFLIGKAGYECNTTMANRMMELVVILTSPAEAPAPTEAQ